MTTPFGPIAFQNARLVDPAAGYDGPPNRSASPGNRNSHSLDLLFKPENPPVQNGKMVNARTAII